MAFFVTPLQRKKFLSWILKGRLRNDIHSKAFTRDKITLKHEMAEAIADLHTLCQNSHSLQNLHRNVCQYAFALKPIEYITGRVQLASDFSLQCKYPILIPRWETLEWTDRLIKNNKFKPKNVIDLGCGTGVIGLRIAQKFPSCQVTLLDCDRKAVFLARKNAKQFENVKVIQGDMYSINLNPYDWIVSNPPYVKSEMSLGLSVKLWESRLALLGKQEKLINHLQYTLEPWQGFIVEISHKFSKENCDFEVWEDSASKPRCLVRFPTCHIPVQIEVR